MNGRFNRQAKDGLYVPRCPRTFGLQVVSRLLERCRLLFIAGGNSSPIVAVAEQNFQEKYKRAFSIIGCLDGPTISEQTTDHGEWSFNPECSYLNVVYMSWLRMADDFSLLFLLPEIVSSSDLSSEHTRYLRPDRCFTFPPHSNSSEQSEANCSRPHYHIFTLGLFAQLTFLTSVFDVYLKTSIVNGVEPEEWCRRNGSAKRLVLIISDGLRADVLFGLDEELALKKIIKERGRWGVSRARMPTRSLQGTLTIGSGMFTDPIAFISLWKKSATRVDTIFDRASGVFYFGHPYVKSYFAGSTGWAVPRPLHLNWGDMSPGKGTAHLDESVIEAVSGFLRGAKNDERLYLPGLIIFVHLSGVDYGAHRSGVRSEKMRNNVMAVDRGVARLETELDAFYGDGGTAFIFTSDHGTTLWGSHGGSSAGETECPLVVWGSGVGGPTWDGRPGASPHDWNLGNVTRRDVEQADLAPLMAALLGVPVPVNSVGVLPFDYLTEEERVRSTAAACNALQLATLAQAAGRTSRADPEHSSFNWTELRENITQLIFHEQYSAAMNTSLNAMRLSIDTFYYYQKYFTFSIYSLTMASFAGWGLALLSYLLPSYSVMAEEEMCSECNEPKRSLSENDPPHKLPARLEKYTMVLIHVFFCLLLVVGITYVILAQWLPRYCVYVALPVLLWWFVACHFFDWVKFFRTLDKPLSISILSFFVVYACTVEFLVWSFKKRYPLSIGLVLVALLPKYRSLYEVSSRTLIFIWFVTSAILVGLLFLPIIGQPPNTLILILSLTPVILIGAFYVHMTIENTRDYVLCIVGLLFVSSVVFVLDMTSSWVKEIGPTPKLTKVFSWTMLTVAPFPPLLCSQLMLNRLFLIAVYYSVPVFLLSIRHEPFVLILLYQHVFCWLVLESKASGVTDLLRRRNAATPTRYLNQDDARRAAVFCFYLVFSYIAMGNYDDISSFDLQCVRCFTSEMNEFLMGFLILIKILFVFLPLVSGHIVLCSLTRADTSRAFTLVLLIVNGIGFHFFLEFTEKGRQWLISHKFSHHCFAQTFIFFLIIVYLTARLLIFANPIEYCSKKFRSITH
ncbi:hypothetical protein AAG570_011945 [Ranatra chinensis]|uniref:GPI ethanolamine phosphate transferase 1 n=1 Tax=Ranatra chinensis TaxID=642074 RepID=A0ABD0YHT1_9HEMI